MENYYAAGLPMLSRQAQTTCWEEGIALGLLRELGDPDPPINAFSVARGCGLEVRAAPVSKAFLDDGVINVNMCLPLRELHARVAHEVGHWILRQSNEWDWEWAATYVAMATLLPRWHFLRDLCRTRWDLRALYERHIYCPMDLIARRITTVRAACMSVWECGRLVTRQGSAGLPSRFARVAPFERDLADLVLERGVAIEASDLMWGVPDFDVHPRRVITVCDAEQLDAIALSSSLSSGTPGDLP